MSSRARTRWGISLAVLVALVVGFTSAAWMPGFAAEPATATAKQRFNFWSGSWIKFRSAEELDRNEGFSNQNKRLGLEVQHDTYTGNAIYTLTESGAIAAAAAPLRFVLRTFKGADGIYAYRLQQYTGEVWVWGDGHVWKQVATPPAVSGVFDLVLTPFGDAGQVNVMRIDQMSGETWRINAGDGPKKLGEPGAPAAAQGSGAAAATPVNVTDKLVGSQWTYGEGLKFDFGKTNIENFSNGWWAMVTWKVIGPNQIELTNPESLASKTMTMTFDTADSYTTTDWDGKTKMTGRRLGPAASK